MKAPDGKTYVCNLNSACACAMSNECMCVGAPVCSGPLVGLLVALEVECLDCGAEMVAIGDSHDPN